METTPELEVTFKPYFDNCSETPLKDTLFTYDGLLHCFYDTEKKRVFRYPRKI